MNIAVEIADALKQIPILLPSRPDLYLQLLVYDAAAAAALLKKDLIKHGIQVTQISRAHGFDIHQDRSKYAYLPSAATYSNRWTGCTLLREWQRYDHPPVFTIRR